MKTPAQAKEAGEFGNPPAGLSQPHSAFAEGQSQRAARRKGKHPTIEPSAPVSDAAPRVADAGEAMEFPTGSTSTDGKDVLAVATGAATPWVPDALCVADKIRSEKDWRWNYHHHVIKHMEVCAESREGCLTVARAGLARIYSTFKLHGQRLDHALANGGGGGGAGRAFVAGHVDGAGSRPADLTLPIDRTTTLRGKAAMFSQLRKWAQEGVLEPGELTCSATGVIAAATIAATATAIATTGVATTTTINATNTRRRISGRRAHPG